VQNQQKITWPSQLTVARAYLDQLGRSQALSADRIADLNKAIARAQKSHLAKKDLAKLHGMAASVETSASDAKDARDAQRLHELAHILEGPTA
jgi:ABC-type phosphate/phosphonate transport system substrate-binding protein